MGELVGVPVVGLDVGDSVGDSCVVKRRDYYNKSGFFT